MHLRREELHLRTEDLPLRTEELHPRTEGLHLRTEELHLRTEGLPLRTEGLHLRTEGLHLGMEELHLRTEGLHLGMEGLCVRTKGLHVRSEGERWRIDPLTRVVLRTLGRGRVVLLCALFPARVPGGQNLSFAFRFYSRAHFQLSRGGLFSKPGERGPGGFGEWTKRQSVADGLVDIHR
jgi:hypothetical protein